MTEEPNPEETKPEETKPEESKPEEHKPEELPHETMQEKKPEEKKEEGPHGFRGSGYEAEDEERRRSRRRRRGDRKARQKVQGFMEMFAGAGLTEERMRNIHNVNAARKILGAGRAINEKLDGVNKAVNGKVKEGCDSLVGKTKNQKKDFQIPPSIIVALMTFSVAFEAVKGMVANVIEGVVEAIMKISGGLSDALNEKYRDKFSPSNDYQEIAIAILLFVGGIYSRIATFLSTFFVTIRTALVQVVLQMFGKDTSDVVLHVWIIIGVFIQLGLLMGLLGPLVIICSVLFLTVLSFFLKMDDLPDDDNDDEDEKKATPEKKEGEGEKKEEEKPVEQVIKDEAAPASSEGNTEEKKEEVSAPAASE